MRSVLYALLVVATGGSISGAQPHMSLPSNRDPEALRRSAAAKLAKARAKETPPNVSAALTAQADTLETAAANQEKEAQPATLFGDVAAAFKTRLSYVRTSLVSGRLGTGPATLELSYISAISSKDSIAGLNRDTAQARVATIASIVQNSGTFGGRVIYSLPSHPTGIGETLADVILEGGTYGPDDHPAVAGGGVIEVLWSAGVVGSDDKPVARLLLGGLASAHLVNAGRLFPDVGKTDPIFFAQGFALIKANDAIAFGIAANAIRGDDYRKYLPNLQLIVKADVGTKKADKTGN